MLDRKWQYRSVLWIAVAFVFPMEPAAGATLATSKDEIWLSCTTHNHSYARSEMGPTASDKDSESDQSEVYVLNRNINKLYAYNATEHTLNPVPAVISDSFVAIRSDSDYSDLGARHQFHMLWTVDRRTLKVSNLVQSMDDVPLGDGRVIHSRVVMSGSGVCELVTPQSLQENRF